MKQRIGTFVVAGLTSAGLAGCASLGAPSAEQLARTPVVELGSPAPGGEVVLKIPAGKPIPTRIAVKGSALAKSAEQTLYPTLPRDLFIYGDWVSEDGKTWQRGRSLFDVNVHVALPSAESPSGGEMVLTVDRKP